MALFMPVITATTHSVFSFNPGKNPNMVKSSNPLHRRGDRDSKRPPDFPRVPTLVNPKARTRTQGPSFFLLQLSGVSHTHPGPGLVRRALPGFLELPNRNQQDKETDGLTRWPGGQPCPALPALNAAAHRPGASWRGPGLAITLSSARADRVPCL